ncbi:hypothetical protein RvY_17800 [Ramazzottius varieornatus]|uniref:Uncharacterized protein n=1 Tax=Ramazzottius varieornatus TaxID=947166 RepID=A0A1D1WA41_RAMVA|nr:hypothetical protein RvY_17800 [Ramazzottius varieornatus]
MSNNRPGRHGGVCKLGHFTSVFTECYKSVNRTVQKTEECFPGKHHANMYITPIDEDVRKMTDDANKISKRHKRIVSLVQQYLRQ